MRAGQPHADFGSKCSECCSDRIGRVIEARYDLDAALVQLDPGLEYKAEIKEIGFLTGSRAVNDADVMAGLVLTKRGRTSGLKTGTLVAIDTDGIVEFPVDATHGYFYRRYFGALSIAPPAGDHFALPGDSGSAIVHATANTRDVVGLLFGGPRDETTVGNTVATPIQAILGAFGLAIKTATAAGQVQVVPGTAAARQASAHSESGEVAPGFEPTWGRIREVEAEISQTPSGQAYVSAVRRHLPEIRRLVNQNRRVGAVWQRNGGPLLVRAVLRAVTDSDCHLPTEICGMPIDSCVDNIASAFRMHAAMASWRISTASEPCSSV